MPTDNQSQLSVEKKSTRRPSLVINVISNWVPLVVNFLVGFLLTPYLISSLGKEGYGVWVLAGSFIGYYGLLRLGVGSGIMRYVPFYIGLKDQRSASKIVNTAMAIFMVVGLLILGISLITAESIAHFFKGGPELASLVRILGVAAAIECPTRVLDACLRAHEKWVAANIVSIIVTLFRAIGLFSCLLLGNGLVAMGFVVLATTIFSLILAIILFVRYCHLIKLRVTLVKLDSAKSLISFGLLTTITTVVYSLRLAGHSIIIGKLISLEAVAIYAVAVVLMKNVRSIVIIPNRVFWPRFAYLDGKNHSKEVKELFLSTMKFCAGLTSGVILIVLTMGQNFIRLWVGEGFEGIYAALMILAAGYLIEASFGSTIPFLGGTGHQKAQAIISTTEGILEFSLSIIFAVHIGLIGVPLGFLISSTVVNGIICPWYICQILNMRLIKFYLECIVYPWLILGALTLIAYNAKITQFLHDWPTMVFMGLVIGFLYAICFYFISLQAEQRKRVKDAVKRILSYSVNLLGININQ